MMSRTVTVSGKDYDFSTELIAATFEELAGINIDDYMPTKELQILKDSFVDALIADDNENGFESDDFMEFITDNSEYDAYELLDIAISEMIDNRTIYHADCLAYIQTDLIDALEYFNYALNDFGDLGKNIDINMLALYVMDYIARSEIGSELRDVFISNAIGGLK